MDPLGSLWSIFAGPPTPPSGSDDLDDGAAALQLQHYHFQQQYQEQQQQHRQRDSFTLMSSLLPDSLALAPPPPPPPPPPRRAPALPHLIAARPPLKSTAATAVPLPVSVSWPRLLALMAGVSASRVAAQSPVWAILGRTLRKRYWLYAMAVAAAAIPVIGLLSYIISMHVQSLYDQRLRTEWHRLYALLAPVHDSDSDGGVDSEDSPFDMYCSSAASQESSGDESSGNSRDEHVPLSSHHLHHHHRHGRPPDLRRSRSATSRKRAPSSVTSKLRSSPKEGTIVVAGEPVSPSPSDDTLGVADFNLLSDELDHMRALLAREAAQEHLLRGEIANMREVLSSVLAQMRGLQEMQGRMLMAGHGHANGGSVSRSPSTSPVRMLPYATRGASASSADTMAIANNAAAAATAALRRVRSHPSLDQVVGVVSSPSTTSFSTLAATNTTTVNASQALLVTVIETSPSRRGNVSSPSSLRRSRSRGSSVRRRSASRVRRSGASPSPARLHASFAPPIPPLPLAYSEPTRRDGGGNSTSSTHNGGDATLFSIPRAASPVPMPLEAGFASLPSPPVGNMPLKSAAAAAERAESDSDSDLPFFRRRQPASATGSSARSSSILADSKLLDRSSMLVEQLRAAVRAVNDGDQGQLREILDAIPSPPGSPQPLSVSPSSPSVSPSPPAPSSPLPAEGEGIKSPIPGTLPPSPVAVARRIPASAPFHSMSSSLAAASSTRKTKPLVTMPLPVPAPAPRRRAAAATASLTLTPPTGPRARSVTAAAGRRRRDAPSDSSALSSSAASSPATSPTTATAADSHMQLRRRASATSLLSTRSSPARMRSSGGVSSASSSSSATPTTATVSGTGNTPVVARSLLLATQSRAEARRVQSRQQRTRSDIGVPQGWR
ncbi:hypothetical protein BC828DRAFT_417990 [Blastocladiella britannica]|nr:hypothetical protein BC828DRAFT_417990 [Blastocladiella britannica]